MLLLNCRYGVKIDMWATGVVCYIMLCGVSPFVVDHSDKVLYGRCVLQHTCTYVRSIQSQTSYVSYYSVSKDLPLVNTYNRNKRSKEIVIEKIRSCRFNFCGRHWEEVSDTAKVSPSVLTSQAITPPCTFCMLQVHTFISLA